MMKFELLSKTDSSSILVVNCTLSLMSSLENNYWRIKKAQKVLNLDNSLIKII